MKFIENLKMAGIFALMILVVVAVFVNTGKTQKAVDEILEEVKEVDRIEQVEINQPEIVSQTIREVTAYNVGDPNQTDETPCIGAYSKVNLCEEVKKGVGVCACNSVPLGTRLLIENDFGWSFECIVWDRMNSRYTNRVDIAMDISEKDRALNFGTQNLIVKVLK